MSPRHQPRRQPRAAGRRRPTTAGRSARGGRARVFALETPRGGSRRRAGAQRRDARSGTGAHAAASHGGHITGRPGATTRDERRAPSAALWRRRRASPSRRHTASEGVVRGLAVVTARRPRAFSPRRDSTRAMGDAQFLRMAASESVHRPPRAARRSGRRQRHRAARSPWRARARKREKAIARRQRRSIHLSVGTRRHVATGALRRRPRRYSRPANVGPALDAAHIDFRDAAPGVGPEASRASTTRPSRAAVKRAAALARPRRRRDALDSAPWQRPRGREPPYERSLRQRAALIALPSATSARLDARIATAAAVAGCEASSAPPPVLDCVPSLHARGAVRSKPSPAPQRRARRAEARVPSIGPSHAVRPHRPRPPPGSRGAPASGRSQPTRLVGASTGRGREQRRPQTWCSIRRSRRARRGRVMLHSRLVTATGARDAAGAEVGWRCARALRLLGATFAHEIGMAPLRHRRRERRGRAV